MASYRRVTTDPTASATAQHATSGMSTRAARAGAGGGGLTRAALYARVSTDKQEREETVASQVALLQQTANAYGYDVLPGNLFIDDGVSGAAWSGLPWSGYATSRPKGRLMSCWSPLRTDSPAAMRIRWS